MKTSNIPSNVKIAIDNSRRAISIRKNYERKLLDVIRTEAQVIYECPQEDVKISCEEIVKACMKVITALLFEYRCDDDLEHERKKRNFYE